MNIFELTGSAVLVYIIAGALTVFLISLWTGEDFKDCDPPALVIAIMWPVAAIAIPFVLLHFLFQNISKIGSRVNAWAHKELLDD